MLGKSTFWRARRCHRKLDRPAPSKTFPNTPEHEWDLDFRGSMNQAVIAGETVLRIALGLVRRHALHPSKNDRLGMANRMTITASISTVFGDLGVENQARVAYADTDVSHLTNLVHLADYFHEAFHVIHMEMCSNETGGGNEQVVQIKGCLYQLFNSGFNEEETQPTGGSKKLARCLWP